MIWIAAALGVVQALTEFLPISSSGHLILIRWFFGMEDQGFFSSQEMEIAFDLALHLGTALAVVGYFWRDLTRVFGSLFNRKPEAGLDRRLAIGILVGCVPAAIVGKFWDDIIEDIFRSQVLLIAAFLILFGVLLWIADRWIKKRRGLDSITIPQAFLIGCAQTLALMPGVSRSGATMTAAMAMGITREDSARFSFLMMCPIVIGATALSLLDLRDLPAVAVREALPSMAVGCSVSLVCGIAVIAGLLKFLRTNSTLPFVIYRILFAASVIATHISRTS